MYINDLPNVTSLNTMLFADDTSFVVTGKDLNEIVTKANSELKKVCTWFRANKLSLHPEKTKFMVFSNNETLIDFEEIGLYLDYNNSDENDPSLVKKLSYVNSKSDVPVIKFLGVYIDCNLNFKYHIQAIRKKISKSLYIVSRQADRWHQDDYQGQELHESVLSWQA